MTWFLMNMKREREETLTAAKYKPEREMLRVIEKAGVPTTLSSAARDEKNLTEGKNLHSI